MMDLDAIQALMILEQEESYSAASRALEIPRTTLRRMISRLEEELGTPLVDNTTQHVRLTHAGALLVSEGASLIDATRFLKQRVQRQGDATIRVSIPIGLDVRFLSILQDLEEQVGFNARRLELLFTDRAIHPVRDNVDLAIALELDVVDGDLYFFSLFQFDWRCFVSPAHPLAGSDDLELLSKANLISSRTPGGPGAFEWPLWDGGTIPVEPRYIVNSSPAARELVAAGAGVGLLPVLGPDAAPGLVPTMESVGMSSSLYVVMGKVMRESVAGQYLSTVAERLRHMQSNQ
jgi:DNA-binding transcriptional LysR family regulator